MNCSSRWPSLIGGGWFAKNVRQYNKYFSLNNKDLLLDRDQADDRPIVYSLAMEGFGSAAWHEGADTSRSISFSNYLMRFSQTELDSVRARRARLLFDISNEGKPFIATAPYVDAIHAALEKIGIAPCDITMLVQNTRFAIDYAAYAIGRYDDLIQILNYDFCPIHFARTFSSSPACEDRTVRSDHERPYRFNCLNYSAREHRIGLVAWLFGAGFDRDGLISFRRIERLGAGGYMESIRPPAWFPEQPVLKLGVERLEPLGHLLVDLDVADLAGSTTSSPDFILPDVSIYEDSYFTIVTESDVSNGDLFRITEKSMKPIAGRSPFVIFGNPQTLATLRGLGFRTFSPLIDETYDEIFDPTLRVEFLLHELKRILSKSDAEILAWSRALQPIVDYNYQHLISAYQDVIDQREAQVARLMSMQLGFD